MGDKFEYLPKSNSGSKENLSPYKLPEGVLSKVKKILGISPKESSDIWLENNIVKAVQEKYAIAIEDLLLSGGNISLDLALYLIKNKYGEFVAKYLYLYPYLSQSRISKELFKNKQGYLVARYFENFPQLDQIKTAKKLIKYRFWQELSLNINKFPKLPDTMVEELIHLACNN